MRWKVCVCKWFLTVVLQNHKRPSQYTRVSSGSPLVFLVSLHVVSPPLVFHEMEGGFVGSFVLHSVIFCPLPSFFRQIDFSIVVDYNSIGSVTMSSIHSSEEDTPTSGVEESAPERVVTRHKVGEALSQAGFGDVAVLSHESADKVLTPARRDIIQVLATHDISSLRELADILDRDPGNLTRDMKVLVAENIIRYVESGKAKRPELKHDTIISEPLQHRHGVGGGPS